MITNSDYRSHSAPLFKKCNLLNVYDMFELELCSFMYKHFTDQLPKVFHSYFMKQNHLHNYNTRKGGDYKVPKTKTTFANKSIRNSGPKFWNTIKRDSVKNSKSIKIFRSQIKNILISKYE